MNSDMQNRGKNLKSLWFWFWKVPTNNLADRISEANDYENGMIQYQFQTDMIKWGVIHKYHQREEEVGGKALILNQDFCVLFAFLAAFLLLNILHLPTSFPSSLSLFSDPIFCKKLCLEQPYGKSHVVKKWNLMTMVRWCEWSWRWVS